LFDRIVFNPEILAGKPVIRGTRISVQHILELLSTGSTVERLIQKYPQLCSEDIFQVIGYAAERIGNTMESCEPVML
jgi:uncharacterized protein (DUF433 family)